MKKTIYLSLLISMISFSGAMAQGLNFGIKGGANFSNFAGSTDNFNQESITSYHAGIFAELGLGANFSIQPELLYSTVGSNLTFAGAQEDFKNELGYLSLPVLMRIYLIPNRLSLDLGPQVSFLMSESQNVDVSDSNTFDFSLAGGATLHVLGPLFVQGRYNLGLTDVKPDAQITNRVVQLSVGLRF
ncbi:Outer membrane protein beta-barrel domain-containing protein [Belliella buryatensis]|uniref:Outer membrane protein beta-barrel domain-containing protein n=1 Tax=Belliella buryatensis TaxID=1500549 RepID=A0A239EY73_9BACT|nr:porin family protein [Belliella buryatensis]SNS49565.1 Outer membrane protein beta-barrel domain-containing protein [Belliella buryatensis]